MIRIKSKIEKRRNGSLWPAETGLFGTVADADVVLQLGEGVFHGLNEAPATGRHPAQGDDGVALGVVVGDGQDFAVGAETVGGAFDDVIGGLAGAGVKDFEFRGGFNGGKAVPGVRAIEDDGDGRADGVAVKREAVDELVARGGGMAGLAGREFRPGVQEAVTVNKNPGQSHAASYPETAEMPKRSFGGCRRGGLFIALS